MRTVILSNNLPDDKEQKENRTEAASLCAEIAERILELRQVLGAHKAYGFFNKLRIIMERDPAAYWICVRLFCGDLSDISMSYSELGKERARTKQAAQQEIEKVILVIRGVYPEVAEAIIQLKRVSAKLEGGE